MRVRLKGIHPAVATLADGTRKTYWYAWKGKGAPRHGGGHGDQFVKLKVVLPKSPDPELEAFFVASACRLRAIPQGSTRRQLEDQDCKGVDVRPVVHLLREDLLRSEVLRCCYPKVGS